ncbi:unnamed protein product [Pipistrellus nathusii]|uniref:Uncharacterized protein n=1 Tax=Pipistrellus nathusii TaxID=59473 RepID=A0ABN9ZGM1_PIPNA
MPSLRFLAYELETVPVARHAYQEWGKGRGSWLMAGPGWGCDHGTGVGSWRREAPEAWTPCKDCPVGLLSATPPQHLFLPVEVACSALSFAQIIDYQESVPTSYVTLGQGLPLSGSNCP